MRKIIFTILVLFSYSCGYSQSITWEKQYDSPFSDDEEGYKIINADGNNFYLLGNAFKEFVGTYGYLIKINEFGDTLWTKLITDNTSIPHVSCLSGVSSSDGGLVFICQVPGKLIIQKFDIDGNGIWNKEYTFNSVSINELIEVNSGGFIGCGSNSFNGFVVRFDSVGNLLWSKNYFSNFLINFENVIENSTSFYIIGGISEGITDTTKTLLYKIDSNGDSLWRKSYRMCDSTTLFASYGYKVDKYQSDFFLLTGHCKKGIFLSKCDSNGLLSDSFVVAPYSYNTSKLLENNRMVFAGIEQYGDSVYSKLLVTNLDGNIQYQNSISSIDYIRFRNITFSSNDILFFGDANFENSGKNNNYLAIRTDSTLYFNTVGINSQSSPIPGKYSLSQNYPNPFNPSTRIKFEIPKSSLVKLTVYDILGREVARLVDQSLNAGSYEYEFDGAGLTSGIYFYKLEAGENYVETKRMVLVK